MHRAAAKHSENQNPRKISHLLSPPISNDTEPSHLRVQLDAHGGRSRPGAAASGGSERTLDTHTASRPDSTIAVGKTAVAPTRPSSYHGRAMRVRASAQIPPQLGSLYEDRFGTAEHTLISCWLRGLELRSDEAASGLGGKNAAKSVVQAAIAGELPILPWKGGIAKPTKQKTRLGATQYLAMWQGLRGQDLDIDLSTEHQVTCSRFLVAVTFTMDPAKLGVIE